MLTYPPLNYPPWYSPLGQRLIAERLQKAEALGTWPDQLPPLVIIGRRYISDATALEAALLVLETVASTMEAHRDLQPVAVLVAAAHDLRDQIIVRVGDNRWGPSTTLTEFAQLVRAALAERSWWKPLTTMPAERPSAAADPGSVDPRSLLTMKQVAKRLQLSEATLTRMEARGELKVVVLGPKSKRVHPAELDRLLKQPKYQYRR
jgi:excisionase family DNA binding protein